MKGLLTETGANTRDRPAARSSGQEHADAGAFACQESLLEKFRGAAEGCATAVIVPQYDGIAKLERDGVEDWRFRDEDRHVSTRLSTDGHSGPRRDGPIAWRRLRPTPA